MGNPPSGTMYTYFEEIEPPRENNWFVDVFGVFNWEDGRVGVWSHVLQCIVILNPFGATP